MAAQIVEHFQLPPRRLPADCYLEGSFIAVADGPSSQEYDLAEFARCGATKFCYGRIARSITPQYYALADPGFVEVLSHLPPAYGAEIIKGLPAERQLAVIRRIAHMGQTNPEVIHEVERGLETRMSSLMNQSFEKAGGVNSVAEILNVSDRATERVLLESLSQEDPELVEEIRRLMFVFDDLCKLSDKDIQAVLKNVETSQWAMALKGASAELKQKIMGNLSQRAAGMLAEEIQYLGPVRLADVEQVQQQVVDVVRRLENAGEITVHAGEESEQMIA